MQNCAESSKLCEKCEKRLVVLICAGNGLKCEYVRQTAKSAIPHPPHLIVAALIIKRINSDPALKMKPMCIVDRAR